MKKKKLSDWEKQERFLEYKMGIKGGCGRSNHSIYETAQSTAWGCGIILFVGFFMMVFGAIYEVMRG